MSSFDMANAVEARGLDALMPFLQHVSFNGQFTLTHKGALAPMLQTCIGDFLLNYGDKSTVYGVELKVEQENKHDNLFLETWSNRNFSPRRVGWMMSNEADFLWYYFLKQDNLLIFNFRKIWEWAHIKPSKIVPPGVGRMYDFSEKAQSKYEQRNITAGRCVPIETLASEVGFVLYEPRRNGLRGRSRINSATDWRSATLEPAATSRYGG